jgi:hypothetical protein
MDTKRDKIWEREWRIGKGYTEEKERWEGEDNEMKK